MRASIRVSLVVFALLTAAVTVLAQAEPPRWRQLNREARSAVERNDYARLRAVLTELRPLMPGNPRIVYSLACAEARLGNKPAVLALLRQLARAGLVYDIAADDDFASVKNTPEFSAIVDAMRASKRTVSHAELHAELVERDLIPEDIVYDERASRFLVSSVRRSKIVAIYMDGTQRDFAVAKWPVLALRIDAKTRTLWATTGWVPHCTKCDAADRDKTALIAYDLDAGAVRRTVVSPVKGLLGDMTISRAGDVYVSEGLYGAVLRLKAGASEFERLDIDGEFPSPQTPALSADEKTLYVPDYLRGIAAIELTTRKVHWLDPAPDIVTAGIDGLYVHGSSFIAVQNGTQPARIMRFSLDLTKQELLEANSEWLGEPTHGTLSGKRFYFLANTGWGAYDGEGRSKPNAAPVVSTIRVVDLTVH